MTGSSARDDVPAGVRAVVDGVGARVASLEQGWVRWKDPRARLVRRRRVAGSGAAIAGATTAASATTTAALVVASAPEWVWVAGGGVTTAVAVPMVVLLAHWRRLRRVPLPAPVVLPSRRPGPLSAAQGPLRRLAHAERGLRELTTILDASGRVPADDVGDTRAAARAAVQALRREASELAVLERAASASAVTADELAPALRRALARLDEGVDGFQALVAAAARAVAALDQPGRSELTDATQRLDALGAALSELAALHTPSVGRAQP